MSLDGLTSPIELLQQKVAEIEQVMDGITPSHPDFNKMKEYKQQYKACIRLIEYFDKNGQASLLHNQ